MFNDTNEFAIDMRKVEMDVRAMRAEVAKEMAAAVSSAVIRVFKAPSALFSGRAITSQA